MLTRIFKSGNSLAVRIPKELQFGKPMQDVEIERKGDALVIRPVARRTLAGVMDKFAAFPADFMADGREFHEQQERDWT
ncbi:type II toxin-antitoxin system VapB family antitoxin [Thermithiobacillus plumbiphilus]|uniref:Type II toxin-antitoxin system VapB family antitoxin n=1 Tax=Thermithiobacillus plumbiphilus TaxID=1729899 RepID=A0ABU9D7I8_9PROT